MHKQQILGGLFVFLFHHRSLVGSLLHVVISVLFLYIIQVHPYLK